MSLNEEPRNEIVLDVVEKEQVGSGIENQEENADFSISSWEDLDISEDLLRGIYSYGYEKPSPIQMKAIKPIMMKRDILAQAQSGTGKTATFSIGALSRVVIKDNYTQVLIMSPTHELTSQICSHNLEQIETAIGKRFTRNKDCDLRHSLPLLFSQNLS